MTRQTPILRTGDTGEPSDNTGNFAKRKAREAALSTPLVREPQTVLLDDGSVDTVTDFGADGLAVRVRSYGQELDVDGAQLLAAETHLVGGGYHDPDPETPAVQSWEGGLPRLRMRYRHGELQDPADGSPAIVAFEGDREILHIHYAGGKVQDPKPGVPAHVNTLANGMTRSTFHTQGTVTEQQDRFPTTLGGIGAITVTHTAT